MIKVLKEAEVTGKRTFVPTGENLKALTDSALEMSTDTLEEVEKLKKAVDTAMMAIAEIMEKGDK